MGTSINDSIKKVNSVIKSLDRDGETQVFPDNPNIPQFRTASIPTKEAEALSKWVVREKAVNTIEIGLAYGFSTLYICQGLLLNKKRNSKHAVIDAWQTQKNKFARIGLNTLAKAGLKKKIEFYNEKSQIALPRLLNEKRQFDFAFVDGCHLCDYVFVDLFYLGQLVKKGGIIFIDDYNLPGIKKAANFYIKNLDWKIEKICSYKKHKWLIARTPKKENKRKFMYFVNF